jgi:hypothetical protein
VGRGSLIAVGIVVVAAPWTLALRQLSSPEPVSSSVRPSAFAWGDRVFSGTRAMASWLSARNASYEQWKSLHPQAVAILAKQPYPPRPRPTPTERKPSPPPPSPIAQTTPRSPLTIAVQILLLTAATALFLTALAPSFLLRRVPTRVPSLVQENRAFVAVVATAILLGYVIQAV